MNFMEILDPSFNERRWSRGSYVAAGFALFIFLYGLVFTIITTNLPTDGWVYEGDRLSDPPSLMFSRSFLDLPSPIQEGDQLLKVNGLSQEQILQAEHEFYNLIPPDWPDGTLIQYEILRDGKHLAIDMPIYRVSSGDFYAGYLKRSSSSDLVMLVTGLFFFVIGLIVFLLRPSNRAAHALLFLGVGFFPWLANNSIPTSFYPLPHAVSIPFDLWTLIINPSLMYLVLAFPYPKAPLRRYPRLSVLLIYLPWPAAFNLAYLLHLEDWRGYQEIAFTIYPIQIVVLMLVTLVALIHSAITVREPVGRNQLKWMLAGVGSFVFVGIGGWLVSAYLFPETMQSGNWLITTIGWFLLPVCLAIAITRYRLFDIDVIIRRTLIYGALTTTLALVYFGGVVFLQGLLVLVTGEGRSEIVIVVTTLAIAALFTPLRKRIQRDIDRRFYRKKYNAEKLVLAFSTSLREEVYLDELTNSLVSLVEESMQPEHVHLWLRPAGYRGNEKQALQ
jgi:hypothetical protein